MWLAKQSFPKEYEPFAVNLDYDWMHLGRTTSRSSITPRSSFEYEAHMRLEELGITSDLVRSRRSSDDRQLSYRDNINGTYRIILHRLQKQSIALERDDLYEAALNEGAVTTRSRSMSVNIENRLRQPKKSLNNSFHSHTPKTKMCIIL